MVRRTGRAAPMRPEERRDALVKVFLDLAHREAREPTTSEIAQEAGVAEGTIFRVFPTKEALQEEAVQAAFCPGPVRRAIVAIDPGLPLRDRLVELTRILQQRFRDVFGLMGALGLTQPPPRGGHGACYASGRHHAGDHGPHHHEHEQLVDELHSLLAVEAEGLVVEPRALVHRLRLLTFSGSHPGIADGWTLTPEEIVDTVLLGCLRRTDGLPSAPDPSTREAPAC